MDFLAGVIAAKRGEVEQLKAGQDVTAIRERALLARQTAMPRAFRSALRAGGGVKVIAEIKRASPSAGSIRAVSAPAQLAASLAAAGAAALSVLTDGVHFGGSLGDLHAVRASVSQPLLRKDFIVDEWQIYEAALAGADAVLLIAAALDDASLTRLRVLAEDELGLDALVEAHSAPEMKRAQECGASLIGVNNRDLRTLQTSLETSFTLAKLASPGACLVSESGLRTAGDLRRLRAAGYHAFLIGESLMRAPDPAAQLRSLITEAET